MQMTRADAICYCQDCTYAATLSRSGYIIGKTCHEYYEKQIVLFFISLKASYIYLKVSHGLSQKYKTL